MQKIGGNSNCLNAGNLFMKESGVFSRSWTMRFVYLTKNTIEWYKDFDMKSLIGTSGLRDATVLVPIKPKYPFTMEVEWPDGSYLPLRASSLETFQRWIKVRFLNGITLSPVMEISAVSHIFSSHN